MPTVLDSLSKHFEAKPARTWKPAKDEHVGAAYFAPKDTGRPFGTLTTVGMSSRAMTLDARAVDSDTERAELIVYVPEAESRFDDVVRWLTFAGEFPFVQDEPSSLGWGHTIRMGPLFEQSALSTLFFLSPIVRPDKGHVFSTAGEPVSFLWLDFLSDAEHALSKREGPNAVLDLYSSNEHPFELNRQRASYC